MSDPAGSSATGNAASASPRTGPNNGTGVNTSVTAPKRPAADGNPAFRMMGLPRLRLPSRNWTIFLTITGTFASALAYDKYQTRLAKQKWCDAVSHLASESLSSKHMPRKLTIYLSAPPGDGLRSAREHFHNYIKPVLVAGAIDWDVVEGRKEGDVRFKTAERLRRKRKRNGEGVPLEEGVLEKEYSLEAMRERTGTEEYPGVAGDLVVGRHTWKEYVRGLHEGWLGSPDAPAPPVPAVREVGTATHVPGQPSIGDAAAEGAAEILAANTTTSPSPDPSNPTTDPNSPIVPEALPPHEEEQKKAEEEKPKPRNPPPYLTPSDYPTATLSPLTPELLGPSTAVRFPHILGFRNTPIRIYRFLTRRRLADDIGREVAAAVLASSYRSYSTVSAVDAEHQNNAAQGAEAGGSVSEQTQVLAHEEKEWWKTVRVPRKEHEESVWIEEVVLDERIAGRMRRFELTGEDEERAKSFGEGKEVVGRNSEDS